MSYFSNHSLAFLRQLARHNNRPWFEAHRAEFKEHLHEPMAGLVEEMDVRLKGFAPEMTGDPKRSIFRLYRDVRFSKDKSPYKTHVACWFTALSAGHGVGSETHGAGAGFYVHVEPGASSVAGGIWMPPRESLKQIREALAARPREFEKTLGTPAFRRRFGTLSEEKVLSRVPKPWDASHPAATWLRHASFTVSASLTDADVTGARLIATVEKDLKILLPMVRWLNVALGYPPREKRDAWG
jgi:uncharacterized protein (TIGR02453 family)